jgi:hypothetical protein
MKLTTERRALLAFAISMLLFVAYDALYLGPKMKEQRAKREAADKLKAQQEAAEHPGGRTDSASAMAPAGRRRTDSPEHRTHRTRFAARSSREQDHCHITTPTKSR